MEKLQERNGQIPEGGFDLTPEIILYSTPAGHRYLHEPTLTFMKGMTTYLQALPKGFGLTKWIADQGSHEKYLAALNDARIRGSELHEAVQDLLTGKATKIKRSEMRKDSHHHTRTWINWYEDYRPDTVAVEQCVFDTEGKIATMIDWRGGVAAPMGRKKEVGEPIHTSLNWKTSSGIYESAQIQTSEKARLFNANPDEFGEVEQMGIVRTGDKYRQRGYEYWAMDITKPEDRVQFEVNNRIVDCLIEIENLLNPNMEPKFPPKPPRELKLPE